MGNLFLLLQQMYNDVQAGALFSKDCHSCAAVLSPTDLLPHVSAETLESYSERCLSSSKFAAWRSSSNPLTLEINDKPENVSHSVCPPREMLLLQLTVIKMMLARLQSQGIKGGIKQKYLDIVGILLKEANIDSKLICLLHSSDKLLSHLASKSLVSLVHFQLTEEGSLNGAWLSFCLATLSGLPHSSHAAECLWTLTSIAKGLLEGRGGSAPHSGTWRRLFAPLDSALEGLHKSVMFQPDVLWDAAASAEVTSNLSSFLDLLELLVASRTRAPLDSACQAMLLWDASGVLRLTTLPVPGFIKRKAVLLLKRGLLHTACEGLLEGRVPPPSRQRPRVERERLALADTVLQFVDSGGLNRVTVSGGGGHFGSQQDRLDGAAQDGSDQVTLRAVSLVLLKAVEVKTQHSASEAEAQACLEGVLCPLLAFVETHLGSSPGTLPFEHPCAWLSELFIEQDDDMLEAAKALLAIYLKCESSLDDGNWDSLTHRSGCNPHCVFLFLLSCIAFDVSVLLDFLISSETCFLEYFVRYLKLLIKDWHHFVRISGRFQPSLSRNPSFPLESLSGQEHASCQPDSRFRTASLPLQHTPKNRSSLRHTDPQAAEPGSPEVWRGSDHEPTLGALQRLAEYESSEEDSGEERWAGARQAPLSRACTATGVGDHAQSVAQQESLPGQEVWTLSSPSYCRLALRSPGPGGGGVLERSVQCLQELQGSISRLHGKRLFPYNPAALLRLLAHLDCVS